MKDTSDGVKRNSMLLSSEKVPVKRDSGSLYLFKSKITGSFYRSESLEPALYSTSVFHLVNAEVFNPSTRRWESISKMHLLEECLVRNYRKL